MLKQRMLRLAAFVLVQAAVYVIWLTVDPPRVGEFEDAVEQPPGLPPLTIRVHHCVYLDRDSDFVVCFLSLPCSLYIRSQ